MEGVVNVVSMWGGVCAVYFVGNLDYQKYVGFFFQMLLF